MLDEVTLDIDSYPIPVHGQQAGSEHNGYYRTRCYHPLGVMLGDTGHWLDLKLRPDNVSAAPWRPTLAPHSEPYSASKFDW